jgi:hypothetical protein
MHGDGLTPKRLAFIDQRHGMNLQERSGRSQLL